MLVMAPGTGVPVGPPRLRRPTGGESSRRRTGDHGGCGRYRPAMAEPSAAASWQAAASERDVLLAAKLHVPGVRPDLVDRPRLPNGSMRI